MTYIAKSEASIFYEVSYSNDNSLLLSINGIKTLITDGRYIEEASCMSLDCSIIESRDTIKKAIDIIKHKKIKKIFLDPSEWNVEEFSKLEKHIKVEKRQGLLTKKRVIKNSNEIDILKQAAKIGATAFDTFADYLKFEGIGKSEQELNWKAKEILSNYGAKELSFEPIVAIDSNSSLPHAKPTNKRLSQDSLILFDAGVKHFGYCSDRTRTSSYNSCINFNYNQQFKSQELQKIYDTVLMAHDKAIELARPGMKACELDSIARAIISSNGYGDKFVHSLGHGVGIEIHEYPAVSSKANDVLCEGMVFTIEPGIYIPKLGGVRIEDTVVMNKSGVEVL